MKQIERSGSAQREIATILDENPGITIANIAAMRRVNERAIARQLDRLVDLDVVRSEGYPKRWYRTGRPLPAVVPRTQKSEKIEQRRRREKERASTTFCIPAPGELERIFLTWQRCGGEYAN
ncbi:helix-turn-helix domain-containing protein [Paraburkholderia tropica]|uniref:hypothetical protein n=1 Tax=Paraburkholderia tropica TaxID=92647 RepID=UPI000945A618|nr:hypothetical protein [Paraburkholderia tropica]RQN37353.1 hypothetical protein EHZ25_18490 [Paraburkholderia tropica]